MFHHKYKVDFRNELVKKRNQEINKTKKVQMVRVKLSEIDSMRLENNNVQRRYEPIAIVPRLCHN